MKYVIVYFLTEQILSRRHRKVNNHRGFLRIFTSDEPGSESLFFARLHMADYVLSCCSTADLSREHFNTRNIECIFFSYELDGKTYPDDLGASMPLDTFYQAMENGG